MSYDAFIVYGTFTASALAFGVLLGMVVQAYLDARKDVRIIERYDEELMNARLALMPFAHCFVEPVPGVEPCGDCDGCRAYDAFMREVPR